MRAKALLLGIAIASLPAGSHAQRVAAPIEVVRRFCQADGAGDRVDPKRWMNVADLVAWQLEPAWDRVWLISGYQVQPPRLVGANIEIDIDYTLVGTVSASGHQESQSIETHTFTLAGDDDTGWRIAAPPPAPHLFASRVDVDEVKQSLDPSSTRYLSASAFVWRMFTGADWPIPYRSVEQLRDSGAFIAVDEPRAGDLALFVAGDLPYHVGLVRADKQIASATLNAGVMETPADAFAGRVVYLRLLDPRTPNPSATTPAAESPTAGGVGDTPRPLEPTPESGSPTVSVPQS